MKKRDLSHKFSVVQKITNRVRDEVIDMDLYVDDRGTVHCAFDNMNNFGIKRTYVVRNWAKEMLRLVYPTAPNIFKYAGPACLRGPCPEFDHKCARPIPEIREEFKRMLK